MLSRSHLRLLSILAIVIAIAHANLFDAHLLRRQETSSDGGLLGGIVSAVTGGLSLSVGAGDSTSSSSTPSSAPSSSAPQSTSAGSTTPISSSSTPPPTSSSSSTPQSTSAPPTSKEDSTSSTPTISEDAPSSTEKVSSTPFTSVTVVTTVVDGSTMTSASTYTSETAKATNDASLNGSTTTKSSGMSTSTRNTVIGVVVGVGGFIILAGLFIVAWRIWGRKKNEEYESDGLMGTSEIKTAAPGSAGGTTTSPFQTTLDQYHAPNRAVNASSNF